METLEIEITEKRKLSMELPFFGKVPNRKRWIRITSDDPPQITTISLLGSSCDVFEWKYPEFIDIQDFEPCSPEDWINAKYEAAGHCMNLKNR
ncbi:MAG: hypothetical protein PHD61_06430 [Bacteroidales bacterium]|nr:hypothetical protein [Lentimicrobiaceae bacterium]MDD5694925.1 hypothetical protein [Bacteroidales bacterium]